MVTEAGDRLMIDGAELVRSTVTPPVGAASERVRVRLADWLNPTVAGPVRLIEPGGRTVTPDVASGTSVALAWITVLPGETLVTRAPTEIEPALRVTLETTVATPGLLDVRLNVMPPAGAGAE